MTEQFANAGRINCFQCRHFYVTHEPAFPYGCRVMGFKSQRLPATVALENSGMNCQSFAAKADNKSPG
ncbi:MAG: uracil-DNA glycosylase [Deltaproteobacteria bacterium CG23_combo_of_CG06-09_8_20_14_all_60_8]|nr:MAG: uracil-DNA glycosylase [Desulfobacterales bacterium CG2_30_60_27]PIP42954.1 MAG: uracil-DNA glycosylase [Deltaproteobacteria bacterium CG23_combo_of_CG06-09_8_20_14_all_60_8]